MSLRIAQPWKNPRTGVFHLRQRTPLDLVGRLQGRSVSLPIGDTWASITVGPIVQASLRTKEPREARHRHSIADGALKRFWHEQRFGLAPNFDNSDADVGRSEHVRATLLQPMALTVERALIQTVSVSEAASLTVDDLFERWAAYNADKRAGNTIKRYRASFRSLGAFARQRDARSLNADDIFVWAEHRRDVEGVSPRSINKNDLVAVSSVLQWATGRSGGHILPHNPARGLCLDEPRIVAQRERTFREHEITAILRAASAVAQDHDNITRSAVRRWCPWLAAYSGARIAELTNLARQDVRIEGGTPVMDLRITKTGEPRTVPLHNHTIEQGFLEFVEASVGGQLFYDFKRHKANAETSPAEQQAKAVAKWVRATVNLDPAVDPNHGWRHTFKTRALGAGIEERLRDAITGHRVTSVGRRYETPSLSMLSRAMDQFPRYEISTSTAMPLF